MTIRKNGRFKMRNLFIAASLILSLMMLQTVAVAQPKDTNNNTQSKTKDESDSVCKIVGAAVGVYEFVATKSITSSAAAAKISHDACKKVVTQKRIDKVKKYVKEWGDKHYKKHHKSYKSK